MRKDEMIKAASLERPGVIALSVIMISIPERERPFLKLRSKLRQQIKACVAVHPTLGDVEIVEIVTDKYVDGGLSIGEKRQMGLDRAIGLYVCWLDDDDDIAPDYIETMLRGTYDNPDVFTFNNLSRFDNFWTVVTMRVENTVDEQVKPGFINRRPYHVCAWRSELAKQVRFDFVNKDEDTGYISKLIPLCVTHNHSNNIIHEYNRVEKSYAIDAYEKDSR